MSMLKSIYYWEQKDAESMYLRSDNPGLLVSSKLHLTGYERAKVAKVSVTSSMQDNQSIQ